MPGWAGEESFFKAIYCKNNFTKDNKVRNMVFLSALWLLTIPTCEKESCDNDSSRGRIIPVTKTFSSDSLFIARCRAKVVKVVIISQVVFKSGSSRDLKEVDFWPVSMNGHWLMFFPFNLSNYSWDILKKSPLTLITITGVLQAVIVWICGVKFQHVCLVTFIPYVRSGFSAL